MAESLRDRKRAATMHHVQEVAISLFEERGFDSVRIEEVAAAAEVSPSTVYRYFGTKEGLVIHDEHDEVLYAAIEEALGEKDLWAVLGEALASIDHEHFVQDAELTLRRTKLWFGNEAVRNATFRVVDDLVDRFAAPVAASPRYRYSGDEARVVVASQIWGLVTAIECWYNAGADEPLGDYLRRMIALIRPAS